MLHNIFLHCRFPWRVVPLRAGLRIVCATHVFWTGLCVWYAVLGISVVYTSQQALHDNSHCVGGIHPAHLPGGATEKEKTVIPKVTRKSS